ncbi:MAG: tRNA (adenosine(37)-N6)-threonylcarbamoyltransferase complex transferase subunit TsaD, partial [Candidatus Omnitrophica bacterium]|nr:tRNA (adenosine(37)-N6)-threonylcarbamoyltransferase complex transferase subunit TsaD [Candidatus Omnitrophota bacterium]
SGIKTAVLYKLKDHLAADRSTPSADFVADLAASFQSSVVEEVTAKGVAACRFHRIPRLAVGGGVIANQPLRERLRTVCGDLRIELAIPPKELCTDNGAMVAGLGYHLEPDPSLGWTAAPDLRVELN